MKSADSEQLHSANVDAQKPPANGELEMDNGLADLSRLSANDYHAGEVVYIDPVVGSMTYIPETGPDGFLQGSSEDEPCRGTRENRFVHILTRPFAAMQTEISRKMWKKLSLQNENLPADPSDLKYSPNMKHPCQSVTWMEALLFSNLLSQERDLSPCYYVDSTKSVAINQDNHKGGSYYCDFDAPGYRLPTEGEWEYMTRAGTAAPFYLHEPGFPAEKCFSGMEGMLPVLENSTWIRGSCEGTTHDVGTRVPNGWNLYNLAGNVREWCWDWQWIYPEGKQVDYPGGEEGRFKVVRGGSCFAYPRASRSANRYGGIPEARVWGVGFRLVRTMR